jgi:N-sulfoglucosamine sulfohydrolase
MKLQPLFLAIAITFASITSCASLAFATEKPNVLIITADDLSADSLGSFGCKLADTSPNLDRLASEGIRFEYAHVVCANCMPSRNALYSGRYPHNNHVEGFYQVENPGYPVMADLMKSAGYFTAIRHKVGHSTPYSPYPAWDMVLDRNPGGTPPDARDPASYKTTTAKGIAAAKAAGKPFCLVMNTADPHKPFYSEGRGKKEKDPNQPSKVFKPNEVPIPGYLFDDPVVRTEMAHYFSSVRRADDSVGAVLEALDESGQAERTIVIFLSDHGMGMPFVKTQLYHRSTQTPLIVRWPGVTKAGAIDREHLVSAVDFLPTLLDIVGAAHPEGLDGRSFEPLLQGQPQKDRQYAIKEYNENSGGFRDPMRGVESKRFLYLFNPWSNGERRMRTATQGTFTYARMQQLAKTDKEMAKRLDAFDHRVLEELYDVEKDPDCLKNLIDDPSHKNDVAELRKVLEQWMVKTGDPLLDVFRQRDDVAFREAYMKKVEKESTDRGSRADRKAAKGGKRARKKVEAD